MDAKAFQEFAFERLLNEDPASHSLALLGTLPATAGDVPQRLPAILRVERTPLSADFPRHLSSGLVQDYSWLFAWFGTRSEIPDVKISVIFPATEVHIRKYTKQEILMVHETPEIYDRIVKPYILSFPPSRTLWVDDLLSGKSEADRILYKDEASDYGYIILPDMKWDMTTVSALYLVAIAQSRAIRSLRDLRKHHLGMLKSIRRESLKIVREKWDLLEGGIRLFVHYQPSYYHFHVHIVNANQSGYLGSTVGQAHLLDDIISMLEIDIDDGSSILEKMTFTYGLGDQHGLFEKMVAVQPELPE
ncbi:hypothetical protein SERLA73DRAFT_79467 [Serpula lacrymans var. lacrymans S7.3]|uniref:Scavenger mRNA decapping enzyme n=2 Tax=Serpula lacrymans var. lacrymans TaxID=341189 RepID=F8QGI5_SERL3|nr:uncharacterized protein SERLADRAFT_433284 [Serpula lacrymans var. lacrymans S7.9]EGN92531.1 hypothetical protein SERLA73DRAFT_79467 [Serpula lacrymans var. lacrymans S7.3]EGO29278.1 hypothetical protein SERLADRAFT_433284 [Serpula lacrymans var. lacrymans S7.9]